MLHDEVACAEHMGKLRVGPEYFTEVFPYCPELSSLHLEPFASCYFLDKG